MAPLLAAAVGASVAAVGAALAADDAAAYPLKPLAAPAMRLYGIVSPAAGWGDDPSKVRQADNYPYFPRFSRFSPVFSWTSGRALWIPGAQTEKMGERWGKTG